VAAGAAVALVGPVAGVFVDRWNRKSTMLRTEAIRAAMVAGLTGLSFVPVRDLPAGLWLAAVYLVVFVLTAAGQFFNPARFATTGDVVPGEDDRIRATGLAEATTSAAGIIGPPIAALLLFSVGFQWALAANAASYAVSYLAIRLLRLAPGPRPRACGGAERSSLYAEFSAGLRLFARNRFLVTLLTVTVICQCGTGAISALNVFFVTRDLHASSGLFGIAVTAMGWASLPERSQPAAWCGGSAPARSPGQACWPPASWRPAMRCSEVSPLAWSCWRSTPCRSRC